MNVFRLYSNPLVRWWWGMDRTTFVLLAALMVLGGVIVTTASISVADVYDVGVYYFAKRQWIFLTVAFLGMVVLSFLRPAGIKAVASVFFALALVGLPLTLVLGTDVKGASRWIDIGGFSLQPTEVLKPALAVVLAMMLATNRPDVQNKRYGMSIVLMAVLCGLIILQPNFSMCIMLGMIWLTQVFVAGVPLMLVVPLLLFGLLGAFGGYMTLDHVKSRIHRFLDPASGDTYQVDQAREALMSGGFFGRGAGEGVVKHHLPDAHTDFIFAVIGEEFGIITCMAILLVYGIIVFRCYDRLLKQDDRFVQIAGIGLVTLFALQALVNMGVVLGVLPTTGMTLPFVSYGGTSTLAMGFTMGMVLALTRKTSGYKTRKNH